RRPHKIQGRQRTRHTSPRSAFCRICTCAGAHDSNRRQSHDRRGARTAEEIAFPSWLSGPLQRNETCSNEVKRSESHSEPEQYAEKQRPPPYLFQGAARDAAADQKKRCGQSQPAERKKGRSIVPERPTVAVDHAAQKT